MGRKFKNRGPSGLSGYRGAQVSIVDFSFRKSRLVFVVPTPRPAKISYGISPERIRAARDKKKRG